MPASYELDVPAGYDQTRSYPLVMAFRNSDVGVGAFRAQLNLAAIADAIIAYPNPPDQTWQFQRDISLVDELMSQLNESYCVDMDRVFALGDGAGALVANLFGCMRGDQIRGIAMLSNVPPPPGPCLGNVAIWLLQRVDTDPMTVGSGLGNRDFWATRNGCDVRMPEPVSPSPCLKYAGCSQDLPVHFCEYRGSAWPTFAVDAAWTFFSAL
jgi:poly(3-hydroxybutyrate) depolymerase